MTCQSIPPATTLGLINTPPGTHEPPGAPDVGTRLITRADDVQCLNGNRETDARTALTRGLAEYISQLAIEFPDNRLVRFDRVFEVWPDPESIADFPSALVYVPGESVYDTSKFTPSVANKSDMIKLPDGNYLVTHSEMVADLMVDIWANDAREREYLVAMLEDGLNPVDWMYGARLELPHYYNERAEFELINVVYVDGDEDSVRRYRRAMMTVRGNVPVTRVMRFPEFLAFGRKSNTTVT